MPDTPILVTNVRKRIQESPEVEKTILKKTFVAETPVGHKNILAKRNVYKKLDSDASKPVQKTFVPDTPILEMKENKIYSLNVSIIQESPEIHHNSDDNISDISFASDISFDNFIKMNKEKANNVNLHSSAVQRISVVESSPESALSSPDMFFETPEPDSQISRKRNISLLQASYKLKKINEIENSDNNKDIKLKINEIENSDDDNNKDNQLYADVNEEINYEEIIQNAIEKV